MAKLAKSALDMGYIGYPNYPNIQPRRPAPGGAYRPTATGGYGGSVPSFDNPSSGAPVYGGRGFVANNPYPVTSQVNPAGVATNRLPDDFMAEVMEGFNDSQGNREEDLEGLVRVRKSDVDFPASPQEIPVRYNPSVPVDEDFEESTDVFPPYRYFSPYQRRVRENPRIWGKPYRYSDINDLSAQELWQVMTR